MHSQNSSLPSTTSSWALRGECTTAGLHFAIECYNDLIDAYDLNGDLWKGELYDLVATLEKTTSTADAVGLARQALPRLRRPLATSH
jgi:hypothetical protein